MELKQRGKSRDYEKKISILVSDLASLEKYISDLFTFLPVPICFISPLGVVLEFNPAFEKISGYSSFEMVGEGIERMFSKKRIQELIEEATKKEAIEGWEAELLTKRKKRIPVSLFAKVRRDEKKQLVGLFISVFDLTKIKQAKRELEEKISELEKFQRLAVGRELKMIELKEEIKRLRAMLEQQ
jgi:PAS domain S-box-containing protein